VNKKGRPRFEPTDEQRKNVEIMVGLGIPEALICSLVRDHNDKPISEPTLRKHFGDELQSGAAKLNFKVGHFMVNTMLGLPVNPPNPTGEARPTDLTPITGESSRTGLLQMYAKTRMGWRETVEHANAKDGDGKREPFVFQVYKGDANL
jgi:hypothetical protein